MHSPQRPAAASAVIPKILLGCFLIIPLLVTFLVASYVLTLAH